MKTKHCFLGAAAIGFLAGVIRILQHTWTIDPRGFYTEGLLSSLLAWLLVGLLAVGAVWSIVCGATQKRGQAIFFRSFCTSTPTRVLFILLAAISFADGGLRLMEAGLSLTPCLCLAGGIAWLTMGLTGAFLPMMELMPLLQLGALIVDYFKNTYKYIQVSTYSLGLLGLCAATYFALVLIKVLNGADCARGRLTTASCLLVLFGCTSFLAPLADGFSLQALIFAVHGFTYCLLAALTLIWMPEGKHLAVPENEVPDPNELDQYINEIPEVQEDEL